MKGVIAAAVACLLTTCTVVTILAYRATKGDQKDTADLQVQGDASGTCVANGISNVLHCAALGPSLANVSVEDGFDSFTVWFDGPPEQLPEPPPGVRSDCRDRQFLDWIRSTDGFYLDDFDKDVILTAGDPDLVILTSADAIIHERTEIGSRPGTYVMCQMGGNSLTFNFEIRLDTKAKTATLTEIFGPDVPGLENETFEGTAETEYRTSPMPPAVVELGKRSTAIAHIVAQSKIGHAYSGIIGVSVTVNGKSQRIQIGTPEEPLRWFEATLSEDQVFYITDEAGRWVQYQPPT